MIFPQFYAYLININFGVLFVDFQSQSSDRTGVQKKKYQEAIKKEHRNKGMNRDVE